MEAKMGRRANATRVTDGLEQLALDEITRQIRLNTTFRVLDLPCGDGRRAAEMARLGAAVLASDEARQASDVAGRVLAAGVGGLAHFQPCVLGHDPLPLDPDAPFDLVFCHCGLNFLPYTEARQVLARLLKSLRIGGKLFVAMHGLYSGLGEGYRDYSQPIETRFCPLAPAAAKCYGIKGDLCLYSERDLLRALIGIGSGVLQTFTTTYGAVKGVAVRV